MAFYQYIGQMPSPGCELDRIDVNGSYEPGNVRWASRKQQCRNTRYNTVIVFRGQPRLLVELAEEFGIATGTIRSRLERGLSPEEAVLIPAAKNSHEMPRLLREFRQRALAAAGS